MNAVDMMTYASFTVPGGRGGWSVGQRSAGLTDDEVRKLTEQVPTRIDSTSPVPQYPSAEDISRLQRRMAWARAPWGGADRVFWFSSPAGEDATGRAGNVFTQIHVFRAAVGEASPRFPSDLLFSSALQFPFGSRAVNSATVAEGAPPPGPLADPAALWPWIFADGPVDRRAVLGAILDACSDGRTVAVVCPPEDASMWVAAVCQAQSGRSARDFSWSTFERARSLATARSRGITLACIPPDDAAEAAELSGVLVIPTGETPRTGVFGGEPTFVGGAGVPVSAWSALLDLVFLSSEDAIGFSRGLRSGDVVAADGGDPAWQLAAAVAANPEMRSAAADPLRGLLARPDRVPRNLGELLSGEALDALLAMAVDGADRTTSLAALSTLGGAGLFDDDAHRERVLSELDERGIGEAIVRGDSFAAAIPMAADSAMAAMLRQLVATNAGLHRSILDGIGLPVATAEWLGVPEMARRFLESARAGLPSDFRAPVWEGDLIGAWVLGALSDFGAESMDSAAAQQGAPRTAGAAEDWSVGEWAGSTVDAGAAAGANWGATSPEMVAFGLNSLVESLGDRADSLLPVVERELAGMPGPERALLAEGPWRPHLDRLGAQRRAQREAREAREAEARARKREEEALAKARQREEEARRRAEEEKVAAVQRPLVHPLAPALVRYVPPGIIGQIEKNAGPDLVSATSSILGLGDVIETSILLGEIALTERTDDLPDMARVRLVILASACSEALLYKWYPETRHLPWWIVENLTDEEWFALRDLTVDYVRGTEHFRAGSVEKLHGRNGPRQVHVLINDAIAILERDLERKRSAQGRTPRDIPAPGEAGRGAGYGGHDDRGGTGSKHRFSKRSKRSEKHK